MSNEQLVNSAVSHKVSHKQLADSHQRPAVSHKPSLFVIRHLSFVICHSSLLTPHSSLLIVILLLATFFCFYQLFYLPPGLNFDEAGNGVAALDILHSMPKIWWRIGGGKEPLWPYLIALSTILLGNIPFALRFPAAVAGILTVAAVYPLMMALFRSRSVALFTMLGLALSAWHLHFSRLGFRAILLPLLSILAFYFLWRCFAEFRVQSSGLRVQGLEFRVQSSGFGVQGSGFGVQSSRFTFYISGLAISALFMALAIYSYLAARLLPLVVIIFFILDWLIRRTWSNKISNQQSQNPKSQMPNPQFPITNYQYPALVRFLIYLLIFLSPLIVYFLFNPANFLARTGTVSIFNSDDLPATAWHTLTLTLGTFLGFTGDANPLVNLPNQAALPFFLVPFFLIGLVSSLYNTIHPYSCKRSAAPLLPRPATPNPHLFLLCWWTVMLLPALLAPEGAPHHLRLIGTIIPTYAFVALGFVITTNTLTKILQHLLRNTQHPTRLAHLLPVTCYLLLAFHTYSHYFIRWPNSTDFTLPLDLYATRLAADIEQTPSGTTYIIPMDIRAAAEARHYTLDYLTNNEPLSIVNSKNSPNSTNSTNPINSPHYFYIPVDEHNAETLLARAAQNADELRVVRWTDDKHHEADAKEIITFLLETNATLTHRESFPAYNIETYYLSNGCNSASKNKERKNCKPHAPEFTLPKINRPILANFDNLLQLNAAFVPLAASPGTVLPVAITLAPLGPMDTDYKASIRLIGPSGERLAQKDRTLMHNFHQGTSLWPPETVNEYYLLPVPPDAPSGNYTVTVVIYHPDTLVPLVADGLAEVLLGQVTIK